MEVQIMDRISSLQKSFNSSIDSQRVSLGGIQSTARILDVKLGAQNKQLVDFYNDQDDEGEVMLLAMILLQLHGVKIPVDVDVDDDLLNKKKRQRTSPDQLAILEQIFQTDKMPNQQTRVQLADQLGMSSRRVQIWFQNKRAKVKRSSKPEDGECGSPSELNSSSSSISPASSPSSPAPSVPQQVESPVRSSHSSAVVPQINTAKQSLQPLLDAQVISAPSKTLPTILDNTARQLKAQQLHSSRPFPFVDNQPVLTASY